MDIKSKLQEIGVQPGKGQNFLKSEATAEALVKAAEIHENHKVLEIGPGLGQITEKLTQKTGNLTVIEKNRNLAKYIQKNYPDAKVLQEDFLESKLEEKEFDRVVSNIPFQISSEIIQKLGKNQVQSALIVQDELADKIVAEPGDKKYGIATIKTQYYFIPVKLTTISSQNFHPQPQVDAAIIKLYPRKDRHQIENEQEFFKLAKALFTHKRKKLRNAFVDARHILNYEKEEAKEIRDQLPHSEKRVNQLDIKKLAEIQEDLMKRK
jgi:16S rRNA (adenine1518-N6/adenine1519-N6)-dimethyltransferase